MRSYEKVQTGYLRTLWERQGSRTERMPACRRTARLYENVSRDKKTISLLGSSKRALRPRCCTVRQERSYMTASARCRDRPERDTYTYKSTIARYIARPRGRPTAASTYVRRAHSNVQAVATCGSRPRSLVITMQSRLRMPAHPATCAFLLYSPGPTHTLPTDHVCCS